jgi:hypothetical protein
MDPITLVGDQIVDGMKLIHKLNAEGVQVDAACWIKHPDADKWYLYVATPLVDRGDREAYRRLHEIVRAMPMPFWIDPFQIRLIASGHSIAKAITALYQGRNSVLPARYRETSLGGEAVEEAYVYPPEVTAAASFEP